MPATKAAPKKRGRPKKTSGAAAKPKSMKIKRTREKKFVRPAITINDPKSYYFFFGNGKADGNAQMKDTLGGKGANLAEMASAGIDVPPGFTISTDVCQLFYDNDMQVPKPIEQELENYIGLIEKASGKKFGDKKDPLLVSVRSGGKHSMPGMMDTILNLGINDDSVEGLGEKTGNMRFAMDNYRRFIEMFGEVVMGIDKVQFDKVIQTKKTERRVRQDSSLQENDLKDIIKKYKKIITKNTGEMFPSDPWIQLNMARDAVFRSWNNPRAISYRRIHHIPPVPGTAVNIQAMVFGNMGDSSCTGVGFTRNPGTGKKELYGEFLINAQGEDVVAGTRTPQPLIELKKEMPAIYKQLNDIADKLEKHYRDTQDFEFTVEDGRLYMLQTRAAKRNTQAAIKIAVEMVKEKLISKEEALMRIHPTDLDQLLHPTIDPKAEYEVVAKGLPASPGAASGKVYFNSEDAVKAGKRNKVILVREETNPDDIDGMHVAVGILTSRGGMTSHAAVVARGMGKCAVCGAESIRVYSDKGRFQVGRLTIKEGEVITLNGSTGEVIIGEVPTVEPELSEEFAEFMKWADEIRSLKVRTNADTPRDAEQAIKFGAEGIGLCRTEHMFFAEDRIPIVQKMIIAQTPEERQAALDKLLPMQKKDFKEIFSVMSGLPVTIRTLDPPLHEFLPRKELIQSRLDELDKKSDRYEEDLEELTRILERIDELSEVNPMLGHRGCRLGIVYPEITEMQVRAIMEAACDIARDGKRIVPEIMIPLVGHINEFKNQKEVVDRIANEVQSRHRKVTVDYLVGTMIEIPRAAVTADEIAAEAHFFSFGTNDLTQMTMGFSRDDSGKFLQFYMDNDILKGDPFVSIDQNGVGQLIKMGFEKGRSVKPELKVGICGEHGGDPDSIDFCHTLGLDYVSCSPYRVPIARLAAAQATLRHNGQSGGSEKKKKGK